MQDGSGSPRDAIEAIFHLYDPPVWLVTAQAEGVRGGLIATSAVRASIVSDLPRMLIAIAKQHHTWGLIQASGRLALHLLPSTDLEAVWHFGLTSGHGVDKVGPLGLPETPDGNPLYPGAASWMDCRVERDMDIGDRTVYLLEVSAAELMLDGPVLTVGSLLAGAPSDRRAEMTRLYARDQAIDSAAILAWRQTDRID